jgi:PPM family protein phosphatase
MRAAVPRYLSAASSDQGPVRQNNEDRVYCDDTRGFFLVIDGMGGHEAGEVAAEIAIERIRARLERQTDSVEQRLREAITLANNAIFEAAEERPMWKGMACVLTAVVIESGEVTVGHVGDSRLYRIKRGLIEKLTRDHSPVGEREDSGELTERAAMQHPRRNEVYRDVGSREHAPDDEGFMDVFKFPFAPESALLLCSDGLTDALSSEEILKTVEQHAGDRWSTVRALIAAATRIGRDNVSVVLVEGEQFAATFANRPEQKQLPPATSVAAQDERPAYLATSDVRTPWFRRGLAYVFYGIVLGAALTLAIQYAFLPGFLIPTPQTLTVAPPGTIGDALRIARAGDTVAVEPGSYSEAITLKEGVAVVARRSGEAVIEKGVLAENLHSARLEGFRVQGEGIGIRVKNSTVTLVGNTITEANETGVEFSGDSSGEIVGCTIASNRGAGIVVTETAAPAIKANLIVENGNQPNALKPGLLIRSSGRPAVTANIFAGNGAEPVWVTTPDAALLERNSFSLGSMPEPRVKVKVVPAQEGRP